MTMMSSGRRCVRQRRCAKSCSTADEDLLGEGLALGVADVDDVVLLVVGQERHQRQRQRHAAGAAASRDPAMLCQMAAAAANMMAAASTVLGPPNWFSRGISSRQPPAAPSRSKK